MASKQLLFYTANSKLLNREVTLIFNYTTIDKEEVYTKFYPVVFKVITFLAGHSDQQAVINWSESYGFSKAQVDSGNQVTPGITRQAMPGFKNTLKMSGGNYLWEGPTAQANQETMVALNSTGGMVDIAVGRLNKTTPLKIEPAFLFRDVPSSNQIVAKPSAVLHAWETSDYKVNDYLEADVQGTEDLFGSDGQNLYALKNHSKWLVYSDSKTGQTRFQKTSETN